MDVLVRQSIKLVDAKRRDTVPWQTDEADPQEINIFDDGEWRPQVTADSPSSKINNISKVALCSWNIDFMLPFPEARMRTAISHLRSLVDDDPNRATTGNVIFLQECVQSDLKLIASDPWIQENFVLSDLDTTNWQSGHYGTVSIIDRRLSLTACFRVHYSQTRMERDGLFCDILLPPSTKIRLCNTHLESLALDPPFRIPQMKLASQFMHAAEVDAAVLAGDLNAIQDFDRHLHTANNLKDAYLERGGREDDAAGHTWGQQTTTAQRERFGTSRMDKILYCGAIAAESFATGGADVMLTDDAVAQHTLTQLGFEQPWITDHLLVKAVFSRP